MTKRTRYFMAGSAAVLVAGLGVGLFAYFGEFPILASPTSGPSELSYVPSDASIVAYANVQDVMNSEFRQRLKDAMPSHKAEAHEEFQEKTGINIEQDVDYVVAWVGPDGNEGTGLVLAKGRFDKERLQALALQHGGQVTQYGGRQIVVSPARERRRREVTRDGRVQEHTAESYAGVPAHHGAMAFLEQGLVAVGTEAAVKRAIDASNGQNISGNDEMMKLVGDIEAGSNAWAVGRLDALRERHRLPEQVRNQLSTVKWFAATGHVNGGISGTFRAEARDDQAAENLRDVVRGFLALARLQAGADPKFANLLQSLQLSGTGTTVALSFEIPAEVLDLLAPKARRLDGPAPPEPPAPPRPDR